MEALVLGMPPAGGVALGFDRLVMLLLGEESLIRTTPFLHL
jgi:aspartyl-tRNA synthetase